MIKQSQGKFIFMAALAAFAIIIGYNILNAPDRRDAGQKIADAIDELPNGLDKASRQLEDRTPADKLSDAAKDAGDDLKKATNQQ
jgi:hypothetical protein